MEPATDAQKAYILDHLRKRCFWEHKRKDLSDLELVLLVEQEYQAEWTMMTKQQASNICASLQRMTSLVHSRSGGSWPRSRKQSRNSFGVWCSRVQDILKEAGASTTPSSRWRQLYNDGLDPEDAAVQLGNA